MCSHGRMRPQNQSHEENCSGAATFVPAQLQLYRQGEGKNRQTVVGWIYSTNKVSYMAKIYCQSRKWKREAKGVCGLSQTKRSDDQ